MKKIVKHNGFTLLELMIGATIFLFAFLGILGSYLACIELSAVSKNASVALHTAKMKLENIKNVPFSQIKATYHNIVFTTPTLQGKGVSYVDDTDPTLLKITVSFSWRQANGRIIGEDSNLDGLLNIGEDKNGNGMLDSPVELVTHIFQY